MGGGITKRQRAYRGGYDNTTITRDYNGIPLLNPPTPIGPVVACSLLLQGPADDPRV